MYNLINKLKEISVTIQSHNNLYKILYVPVVLLYQPTAEVKTCFPTRVQKLNINKNLAIYVSRSSMDTNTYNTIDSFKLWLYVFK